MLIFYVVKPLLALVFVFKQSIRPNWAAGCIPPPPPPHTHTFPSPQVSPVTPFLLPHVADISPAHIFTFSPYFAFKMF